MGLPPPGLWNDERHQREREECASMRDDLERWAAIWTDGLSQAPLDNANWMGWCPPFLEEVFANGGNIGLERLLRRWQPRASFGDILRDLCERAWRQAAPRRQVLLTGLAELEPMRRYELEMMHWRELAALRQMMREALGARAPRPREDRQPAA
eukprot:7316549-Pyramimonas_sp.AAC.2